MDPDRHSQQQELLEYVERFALVLAHSGLPRMPARVFAYVLAEDATEYTAAQLATGLGVSHAAISGAVRHLVEAGLLYKGRKPGSRADHYYIRDSELWVSIISQRSGLIDAYVDIAREGVDRFGVETPGGARMRQTEEFFKFMREEQNVLLERWREHWERVKDRRPTGE